MDDLFGFAADPVPAFAGRARPFDDAGAPFILVPYTVPQGALVRSLTDFVRLCPKATADERAQIEAYLIDVPCVHVIPVANP